MQERKVILTWEAIYDVTDIADYIEQEFGRERADRFEYDMKREISENVFWAASLAIPIFITALTPSLRNHSRLPSFFIS